MSNLSAKGTVRIAIKPLLDELPVAGGIKVGGGSLYWLEIFQALAGTFHAHLSVQQLVLLHRLLSCVLLQYGCHATVSSAPKFLSIYCTQISFLGAPDFHYDMR